MVEISKRDWNLHSRDTSLGYHTPKCPKPA